MSDRIKGVVVTFDKDYKDEDAEQIIKAILMVRGVLKVDQSTTDIDDIMNRNKVRLELESKIWRVLREEKE